mgnify:CR=1 FL=1
MKIIKKILLAIGILIFLILVSALFIKKEYAVEREIIINKPASEVYDYVRILRNQNAFSTFAKKDPNMKSVYTGIDGEAGSVFAWEGNNEVGSGEQKITKLTKDKRIDIEMHFIDPFESYAPAYFTFENLSAMQTKVKWGMNGKMAYPLNFMRLFFDMEEMIGKEYEASLQNLKLILEKEQQ